MEINPGMVRKFGREMKCNYVCEEVLVNSIVDCDADPSHLRSQKSEELQSWAWNAHLTKSSVSLP